MIHYKTGNLLESEAQALVNSVNTVGVMGKGIALQFKNLFPDNFKSYANACRNGEMKVGRLLISEEQALLHGKKIIINFPTKTNWRLPSEYKYIEDGLNELVKVIKNRNIKSIAIPPLGSGNGGLDWNRVKKILEKHLSDVDCDVFIYEPNAAIQEALKKERVRLTPARAMLLSVFYSSKDKKPFEELGIVPDGETEVNEFLNKPENATFKDIVERTKRFFTGFYSPFGLELLSTIDYIITDKQAKTQEAIIEELANWGDRKKTLFTNPNFVKIAI